MAENQYNSHSEEDTAAQLVAALSDGISSHMEEQSVEQLEQDLTQVLMPDDQGDYTPVDDAFIAINQQLSDSSQARDEEYEDDGESAYGPDQDFEEDDEDYFSGEDVHIGE